MTRLLTRLGFLALAVFVTGRLLIEARAAQPSRVDALLESATLPSQVLRVMSLGFESAAADIEYFQAIQAFGERSKAAQDPENRKKRARAVAQRLEYATDFDPFFNYAYVFAANSIPTRFADGTDYGMDETIRLLEKGTAEAGRNCRRQDPNAPQVNCDWRVPFYLAYFSSTHSVDFKKAAEAMADAAQRPKHPEYIEWLATRLAAVGGAVETGLDFCHAMIENAESEEKRAEFEARCLLLEMERDLRLLDDAVTAYMERNGERPANLDALVTQKFLDTLPTEPHGGRYELDVTTGEVRSTAAERLKLPDTVQREIDERKRRLQALQKEP